jgi:hypothetical protein
MIDNVDRMSVNILPFSLDRIVSRRNRVREPGVFIIYQINQDQLCQFVAYEPEFVNIFQSNIR